ncbi:hypothetical protein NQ317_003033, partial [Molorchus minor]
MANTNTDLTEEDAADLLFPKEEDFTASTFSSANYFLENSETTNYCANCFSELVNLYILCEKCNINICCSHKNDHDYRVLTTKFILFENSDWTAEEELKLLDAISAYGNWNLVAHEFPNKSRNGSALLPEIKKTDAALFPQPVVPYRFRLVDNDDPPRYAPNTIGYQSLAGYNSARSDFESEYDKNAEDILSNVEVIDEDNPQYEFLTNLQCSLIESYNRRLRERFRWKNIISQHGLLLLRKTVSWLHRYDLTLTRPVYEKLIRFMQFCEPAKFEMHMEGLHRVGELKLHISRLIQLRRKGITTMTEARLYLKLHQIHEENKKSLKLFRSSTQYNWRHNKNVGLIFLKTSNRRSSFVPIEIIGMPGYEKLTEKERDLCSNIRLVPVTYLELKEVLVAEYKKMGNVKLQTARRLLKIDVNKTRKLFDFLIEEGYIAKP